MRRPLLLLLLPALLLVAGRALADIVHLKTGGRVEGKATRDGSVVVVETIAGKTTVKSVNVERIDFDHTAPIEEYYALLEAARAKPEAARYFEVAAWALESKAMRYVALNVTAAVALLQSTKDAEAVLAIADRFEDALGRHLAPVWEHLLELDESSERARRALGYRRVGTHWLTEGEFQASQGKVGFEGEWITPARRDLIERGRAARFDEREKAIERAEKAVVRRENAVAADKKEVARAKRTLEARAREIASERARLEVWDRELTKREKFVNSLRVCRLCRAYYTGVHICPNQWFHCRACGGYFPSGHRCPR